MIPSSHFYLLLLCLFPVLADAQDSTSTQKSRLKGFYVGVNVSPNYCYRTLVKNEESETINFIVASRDDRESYKIGFNAGLVLGYRFNERWTGESGFQYAVEGYQTKITMTFGDMIDPRYGFVYSPQETSRSKPIAFIDNWKYVGVPVRMIYSVPFKRLNLIASAGLTYSYLILAQSVLLRENGDRNKEEMLDEFEKSNLFSTLSIGVSYKSVKRITLSAEPTVRYGLINIHQDTGIGAHLWNAGINVSAYYTFK